MSSFIPKSRDRTIIVDFQIGMHTLDDVEKYFITRVLDHVGGNRTQAAATLGISIRTLQRRLKTYNMQKYMLEEKYHHHFNGDQNGTQHC